MEEKNFAAQVLDAIKSNAFAVKKILFNLDDCVPKSDFDTAQEQLHMAEIKIDKLEKIKTRLENEIDNKTSEITDLLRQHSDLKNKVDNQRDELERKQISLHEAQEKISQLGIELADKNSQLDDKTKQLAEFEEKYFELEQAFTAYKNLSDETKFALEGIFGEGNSPTNFLAGALQEGHLESLFDYVATTLNSGNNPREIETLLKLFDFCFEATNSGRRDKIYSRLDIKAGDDFASAEMRKTSNSAQSGSVQKILLVGYKFIRTNKVIRPSLVVLG